jgi:hypothetical protein
VATPSFPISCDFFVEDDYNPSTGLRCGWYSGTPQRHLFEISFDSLLHHYELVIDDDLTNPSMIELAVLPDDESLIYEPYRLCNDTVVRWWSHDQRINAKAFSIPSSPSGSECAINTTFLCAVDSSSYTTSSFCPFSGRLAYIEPLDETTALHKIKVLDFLSVPPAMRPF